MVFPFFSCPACHTTFKLFGNLLLVSQLTFSTWTSPPPWGFAVSLHLISLCPSMADVFALYDVILHQTVHLVNLYLLLTAKPCFAVLFFFLTNVTFSYPVRFLPYPKNFTVPYTDSFSDPFTDGLDPFHIPSTYFLVSPQDLFLSLLESRHGLSPNKPYTHLITDP